MGCAESGVACVAPVCRRRPSGEGLELTNVTLERESLSDAFGARIIDTESTEMGLMIVRVIAGSPLSRWNASNPSKAVAPGDCIAETNGHTETWQIMEELAKATTVEMVVRRAPPGATAFVERCSVTDESLRATALVLRRTVRAGDVPTDQCAICLEGVDVDERIAGLECGHGFHQRCILRWLGRHGSVGVHLAA
ncbi:unnamed protein product [Prorocentrum cordatum]|uniref:RING-type E3 ubiquitin transferase n=1 Tax=Prorocentrum cordatum TaxID=2364126 RepID=A0ABN9XJM5_9DINO|nr:unnamed protein product [Polarella glacialis]